MTPGIEDVKKWYNNILWYMREWHDPGRRNGRYTRVKLVLDKIIEPGTQVLDLGCGTGITTSHIGLLGAKVLGVDIADKLVGFAKEHSTNSNTSYMVEDIVDMRLGRMFDTVVMCDVLEHVARDRVLDLMHTVDLHCGDATKIYLNIPDGRFSRYALSDPQIIDEAWDMVDVLGLFGAIGFEAVVVGMYGVDTCLPQYNEYVFVRRERVVEGYGK